MTIHIQLVSFDKPGADKEDAAAFAARLDRVTGVLKKASVPAFDILGVTSAYAPVKGLFPLPEEAKIPAAGGQMYAVDAVAKLLANKPNELFSFLSSEQGIIGRAGRVEAVGEWAYRNVGPYLPGALRRCAVGGRLRLQDEAGILPFFVMRVSSKTANAALRQAQVMGLIAMAKETWNEGDLTPIVVGDFGFERDGGTLWQMMCTDFDEVTVALGQGGTEHVWVGRESAFRGSKGTLAVTKAVRLPQLNDGGENLTSHAGIAVEAEVRTWRSKRTFNASPRARSRGAPAVAAAPESMHLAWGARQTSGQVTTCRTQDGIVWSEVVSLDGHTNVAPALCAANGKVVLAWTELDGKIAAAISTNDGESFGPKTLVSNASSDDGPALFFDGGELVLCFASKESGKLVMMRSSGDLAFSGRAELPFASKHTPALARYHGQVWLAWTETDQTSSVSIATSADGKVWDASKTSFATHPRRHSAKGPALLVDGERLTLGWIGSREANGYAWFAGMYPHLLDDYYRDYFKSYVQWTTTKDGRVWSVERALDERSEFAPALASFKEHVYVAWTGTDASNLVNVKISDQAEI
ncbi:MAG: hypothetical protein IPK82_41970 [Polyangiaceae bacterium]|nr:hypothetical protein [Polyangiaceae bacterium]